MGLQKVSLAVDLNAQYSTKNRILNIHCPVKLFLSTVILSGQTKLMGNVRCFNVKMQSYYPS